MKERRVDVQPEENELEVSVSIIKSFSFFKFRKNNEHWVLSNSASVKINAMYQLMFSCFWSFRNLWVLLFQSSCRLFMLYHPVHCPLEFQYVTKKSSYWRVTLCNSPFFQIQNQCKWHIGPWFLSNFSHSWILDTGYWICNTGFVILDL